MPVIGPGRGLGFSERRLSLTVMVERGPKVAEQELGDRAGAA
jgi:hypothetical protein